MEERKEGKGRGKARRKGKEIGLFGEIRRGKEGRKGEKENNSD